MRLQSWAPEDAHTNTHTHTHRQTQTHTHTHTHTHTNTQSAQSRGKHARRTGMQASGMYALARMEAYWIPHNASAVSDLRSKKRGPLKSEIGAPVHVNDDGNTIQQAAGASGSGIDAQNVQCPGFGTFALGSQRPCKRMRSARIGRHHTGLICFFNSPHVHIS